MDVSRDLELFRKLILCSDGVWSWRYDAQGNLLSSDCPPEALFATAFSMLGCKEQMLAGAAKACRYGTMPPNGRSPSNPYRLSGSRRSSA